MADLESVAQTDTVKTGLDLMREKFEVHQISKLPKPTKAQTEAVKADFKAGVRCGVCGGWHHKDVIHLDYVGHAALTDRLLDCDPLWSWEPVAFSNEGLPVIDKFGGMWIRLTVCGVSRLGYGHPDGKTGGDAMKEVIGDALRNAAMRFGAALDLWHKGDLHIDELEEKKETPKPVKKEKTPEEKLQAASDWATAQQKFINESFDVKELEQWQVNNTKMLDNLRNYPALSEGLAKAYNARLVVLSKPVEEVQNVTE